jgi:hypothetical protein
VTRVDPPPVNTFPSEPQGACRCPGEVINVHNGACARVREGIVYVYVYADTLCEGSSFMVLYVENLDIYPIS